MLAVLGGLLIGVSLGLTGVGAGVLLTPFLIIGLHVPASVAVGTSLGFGLVTKVAGAAVHWRQGTVDRVTVLKLSAGSIPAVVVAGLLLTFLFHRPEADALMARLVAIAVIASAAILTVRFVANLQLPRVAQKSALVAGLGALVGAMLAVTSVGSGSVAIAGLSMLTRLKPAKLIGTDMAHAVLMAAVALPFYASSGRLEWGLLGLLVIGSLPGVLVGSRLVTALPERWTKAAVLVTVWALGLRLL